MAKTELELVVRVRSMACYRAGWAIMRAARVMLDVLGWAIMLADRLMSAGQRLTLHSFEIEPPSHRSVR